MNPAALARESSARPAAWSALVVDDDEFVRGLVARQLQAFGAHDVGLAADGAAAQPGIAVILMSSADPKVLRTAQSLARRRDLRVVGAMSKPIRAAALRQLLDGLQTETGSDRTGGAVKRGAPGTVSEAELRAGIERGELDIVVQPQIDLSGGGLAGVEALVRWQSPVFGTVTPDRFLGLVEKCALVNELTDQVLRRAVAACGSWRQQGLETRIAINFAPETLARDGLPDRVVALAGEYGVRPAQLVVEMTEQRLLQDLADPLEVLTRLRLRGIELSIDDFGTGYSSLERLQNVPFSELKIDRSFVIAAPHQEDARRIIASSVRLAHDLGLRTVAEGVEDAATLALVRALGCDVVQGYYFARPMTVEQLLVWSRQLTAPRF
jgi:EAL domain-containing protein (putative c-di-GMP-specific phosphodiesterase class I)